MKIQKEKLLIVAGVVWAIAGSNILRIGIASYIESFDRGNPFPLLWMIPLSALILTGFMMMFRKVVKRNTRRILSYTEKKSVFAFFDIKGYLLMAFMMALGITLRSVNLLPAAFFAVFYTGLGTALTLSGVRFIVNYTRALRTARESDEAA